jgi:hypothetical protein
VCLCGSFNETSGTLKCGEFFLLDERLSTSLGEIWPWDHLLVYWERKKCLLSHKNLLTRISLVNDCLLFIFALKCAKRWLCTNRTALCCDLGLFLRARNCVANRPSIFVLKLISSVTCSAIVETSSARHACFPENSLGGLRIWKLYSLYRTWLSWLMCKSVLPVIRVMKLGCNEKLQKCCINTIFL